MNIPKESGASFITYTFSMLGKIAGADGTVSPEEIAKVEQYIDRVLRLDGKLRLLAMQVFRDAVDSPLELQDYAERFKSTFVDKVQLASQLIEILLELSIADGRLSPEEDSSVRSAALLLELSIPAYEGMKQRLGIG